MYGFPVEMLHLKTYQGKHNFRKEGRLAALTSPTIFSLFIMCPHSNNLYRLNVFKNLIDKTMLYVDSSGIGAGEVADELFKAGWILVWVFTKNIQEA